MMPSRRLYSPAGLRQLPSGGLKMETDLSREVRRMLMLWSTSAGGMLSSKSDPSSLTMRAARGLCVVGRSGQHR